MGTGEPFYFTQKTWPYYFPGIDNPGHYTTNPGYFSNIETGKILAIRG
jgi:hypothetical protein